MPGKKTPPPRHHFKPPRTHSARELAHLKSIAQTLQPHFSRPIPAAALPEPLTKTLAWTALSYPRLLTLSPDTIAENISTAAAGLRLEPADYLLTAVLSTPKLFEFRGIKAAAQARELAQALELPGLGIRDIILANPALLLRDPQAIADNIAATAKRLKIAAKRYRRIACKHPHLLTVDAAVITENTAAAAAKLQIKRDAYFKAALANPTLLTLTGEAVLTTIHTIAALADIKPHSFITIALRRPSLLTADPNTLADNLMQGAERSGIPVGLYLKAVRRQPALLHYSPATIAGNVAAIRKLLDLPPDSINKILVAAPPLLYANPETIAARLHEMSKCLGWTPQQIAAVVRLAPTLCLRSQTALGATILSATALLGITRAQYLELAIDYPRLLLVRTESLAIKLPILRAIRRALKLDDNPYATLAAHPNAAAYATDRLKERLELASHIPDRFGYSTMLVMTPRMIEPLLREIRASKKTDSGSAGGRPTATHHRTKPPTKSP